VASVDEEVLNDLINIGAVGSLLDQLDSLRDVLSDGLFGMFGMGDQFDEALSTNTSTEDVDFDLGDINFEMDEGFAAVLIVAAVAVVIVYAMMQKQKNKKSRRF